MRNMNKIKVLVVEDEAITAMQVYDILDELGYNVIEPVTNYEDAVEILLKEKPDIALLDIKLEGERSGIDIADYIKKNFDIPYIFLTSKADPRTLDQVKQLNPPAYLMKPFNHDDLYTSIELVLYNYHTTNNFSKKVDVKSNLNKDAFFVKDNNSFHKILFSEILYAKSEHVYIEVYTKSGKQYLIRNSMNNFTENLPSNFLRVHRSYTINLDHIKRISPVHVFIENYKIPIGKNYRDQLMKVIGIM